MTLDRAACLARDDADPLAHFRDRFVLPEGVIYLDGNSLGPLPKATTGRLQHLVEKEWAQDLIQSWWKAGWVEMPRRVGDKLGRLIGAAPGQTVVCDSTSVNIFKVLAAAMGLRPDRRVVLVEEAIFPTDGYILHGLAELMGAERCEIRARPRGEIADGFDDDVAVGLLNHAHYRDSDVLDMATVTAQAHAHGCLTIWDAAHSVGALPVPLDEARADFAVGCGYKFLNGGPGGPAFVYVAERHQEAVSQPLSGWLGHASPFDFASDYRPGAGIDRFQCGTPVILGMAALECGVDVTLEADMDALRAKSQALTSTFIEAVEQLAPDAGFELSAPRDPARRSSQVCFSHPRASDIMPKLIEEGVIGDFRPPHTLRFGFAPLYNRFVEAWDAAERLAHHANTAAAG